MGNLHLYTKGTLGGVDGVQITESSTGAPRIAIAALRGLAATVPICIRSSNHISYIVKISLVGNKTDQLWVSYDGATWVKNLFFFSIGLTNSIFYLKTTIGEEEDYGSENSNFILAHYWNQV